MTKTLQRIKCSTTFCDSDISLTLDYFKTMDFLNFVSVKWTMHFLYKSKKRNITGTRSSMITDMSSVVV